MINERTYELIYCIYEGGMEFQDAIFELTNKKVSTYNRDNARNLITSFLNRHATSSETIHPVYTLEPRQLSDLVDLITTEINGGKINLLPDGPSVW